MTTSAPTRPVMRYHGGKWMLAPWLLEHLPRHQTYCEPYAGCASVLMRKPRSSYEVLNDLSQDLINVFRVLRDPAASLELERLIRLTPFSRVEFDESYRPADDWIEQARRTVVRSFMGFGTNAAAGNATGFRAAGRRRSGSAPQRDWDTYPAAIAAFCARLQGVVIECRDALEVIAQQDSEETCFYVDPPYPHSTRSQKNPYCKKGYTHEMVDDDHRRLAEALHEARGMVLLSGYACDLYDRELYPDWERITRPALADGGGSRTEVLWLSPAAVARGRQLRLMEVSA